VAVSWNRRISRTGSRQLGKSGKIASVLCDAKMPKYLKGKVGLYKTMTRPSGVPRGQRGGTSEGAALLKKC